MRKANSFQNRIWKLLLMGMFMLFTALSVSAGQSQVLVVADYNDRPLSEVQVDVYQLALGTEKDDVGFTMTTGGIEIQLSSDIISTIKEMKTSELSTLISSLKQKVKSTSLHPIQTVVTGNDGMATVSLEQGIYLFDYTYLSSGNYTADAALLFLPEPFMENDVLSYREDVSIDVKLEYHRSTSPSRDRDTLSSPPTNLPTEPEIVPETSSSGGEIPSVFGALRDAISEINRDLQTGDSSRLFAMSVLFGASFLVLTVYAVKKRKGHREKECRR